MQGLRSNLPHLWVGRGAVGTFWVSIFLCLFFFRCHFMGLGWGIGQHGI